MRGSHPRITGATVLAVALLVMLAGCGVTDVADITGRAVGPGHDVVPFVDASVGGARQVVVRTAPLPSWLGRPVTILVGDVVAGAADEVVVAGPGGFVAYERSGRQVGAHEVSGGRRAPGVLVDADGDGKLDVVLGSDYGADAELSTYNGRGRRIAKRRVVIGDKALGRVVPFIAAGTGILVAAEESWLAGPRGVMRVDPATLDNQWFAAVPTGVVAVAMVGESTAVSNRTQHNGEFNVIGAKQEWRFGLDTAPQLLLFDAEGSPVAQAALAPPLDDVDHTAWLLPLGHEGLLAHVEHTAGAEALQVRGLDGRLIAAWSPTNRLDSVVTSGTRVVAITGDEVAWTVRLLDTQLEPLVSHVGSGPLPTPVAVSQDDGGPPSVIAVLPGAIVWYNADGAHSVAVPELAGFEKARATAGEETLLIVAGGERLVLVELTPAGQ